MTFCTLLTSFFFSGEKCKVIIKDKDIIKISLLLLLLLLFQSLLSFNIIVIIVANIIVIIIATITVIIITIIIIIKVSMGTLREIRA